MKRLEQSATISALKVRQKARLYALSGRGHRLVLTKRFTSGYFLFTAPPYYLEFSDSIFFMLLTHDKFRQFTDLEIIDARRQVQALLCLSRADRAAVDSSIEAALAAGGTADPTPKQDYGDMMYGRSVASPDGHIFELMWMAPQAAEQGAQAFESAQA